MRAFKNIRDPRGFEVMADETRRRIIYLLRAKEQTVSQLAESLNKTPQAIYHQIKILLDIGLVEVAKEERVEHFIETYYRAAAEVFEFSHGKQPAREEKKQFQESLEVLGRIGVMVNADEETAERAVTIMAREEGRGLSQEIEEKISQLDDVAFFTRQHAAKLAQLITMSDKQFEEMLADERELRKLLTSSMAKTTSKPGRSGRSGRSK